MITPNKRHLNHKLLTPVIALVLVAVFAIYTTARPAAARAASVAPAAAPLSPESVGALLSLDQAMETLAARVTPAVVNVAVTSHAKAMPLEEEDNQDGGNQPANPGDQSHGPLAPFFRQFPQFQGQGEPQIEHGIGSGVIISPDGFIVTNNHVVQGAVDVKVTLSDRRVMTARVVGTDPLTDLAVIKVNGSDLPSAPWGDSTALRPGQTVLAFGNPFGLRFTVTRGIVSALNRANPYSSDRRKPGEFIQTDAAINQGNSGGPLVDARGEVIGINTFLLSPSGAFAGMGFAIPAQVAQPTVENLVKYGKVSHGYMGIGIEDVTPENARFFDMKDAKGAIITQVEPGSPGSRAGLKTGDVITELDGKSVTDAGQLQVMVGQTLPETKLKLTVIRDGKSVTVPVTLEEMGGHAGGSHPSGTETGKMRWGLGLMDLTPDLRQQLQVPDDVHGAVVARVEPGTPADDAGLSRGDVILQVDRQETKSAGDVQKSLSSVSDGKEAMVLVWSHGGSTFRVLPAPKERTGQPS
ncbi:MAG: Do family serine endopeptidase [Terriglobales bacterium]